jgi:hypothetical protein
MYRIPAQNVQNLTDQVAELNKRAEKLGVEPVRLIPHGTEVERRTNQAKVEYDFVWHLYEIEGTTPKLAGWTLVAAIERLGDENLVRCVPGQTCPVEYRQARTDCDHCKTDRRRKEVFVLRHEDGRHVQVGRQCITDFLGGKSPESIIAMAEFLWAFETRCSEAADEMWGCDGCRYNPSIEEYLATVAICIRKMGWVSAKMAQEDGMSSAYMAWRVCVETNKYIKELIDEKELFVEDRDVELATAALEWAKALPTTAGDYEYSLGVACRAGVVHAKTRGIIASAIASYQRHKDRLEELHIKAREAYKDEHVGILKERRGFKVTVKAMRSFEGDYGVKTLVRMKDEDGRTLIWWATGDPNWLKEGETVEITGTVKDHGEYQGKKQTQLSRVVEGLPKPKRKKAA